MAGRVDLDHIYAPGAVPGQVLAGLALPAGLGAGAKLTIEGAGKDPGGGGLAAAARTGEEVRVIYLVIGQGTLKRLSDMVLADHIGEPVRPVPPVQGQGCGAPC